ncbi:MAG: roadblock/LC7 domain-containing protein [Prosthecobacter sp.]|jgi:predicted regulator of Ras-like GTPase activity (Roadblock/LC7/MglB family)|uniref:roadblock/LC7 domain-containing protein n=1 Tax=Prosthecobacter sp. TaxID=1965333 RepID=UPI0019FACC7C|nr:roadblock/LC7 domain-containing protein [Prosthecobacter sp.]MBE2287782.1 roadblock/LC7 domain-containing protein [Prosthecobacter sp.]
MAANKSDALKTILNTLSSSSGDIEASAVVSSDGLMIASNFPAGLDEDRVAAMSAALLAMGERSASELERGGLEQIFIKGEKGNLVMMAAGPEGVLTTLTTQGAKLGLVFLDMKRAAKEIARII